MEYPKILAYFAASLERTKQTLSKRPCSAKKLHPRYNAKQKNAQFKVKNTNVLLNDNFAITVLLIMDYYASHQLVLRYIQ